MSKPKHEVPIRCDAICAVACRGEADATQVLMLRRASKKLYGEWCQIAGGIEAGETAPQAVLREMMEETGLVPDRLYSADTCEQFYDPDRECINIFPVFVAFIDREQEVVLNHEHSAFEWVSIDEAVMRVPFSGQREVLRHVESEFVARPPNERLRLDLPI
jgi:dihydroneopterin triphosphate diphosphatase